MSNRRSKGWGRCFFSLAHKKHGLGGVGVIVGLGGAGQEMRDYSLDL